MHAVSLSRHQAVSTPTQWQKQFSPTPSLMPLYHTTILTPQQSSTLPLHFLLKSGPYVVGFGFIFLLPPVMVTFTKRRVYVMRFFARPLGVFFFSCGSTCIIIMRQLLAHLHRFRWAGWIYLWSLRLHFACTGEGAVDFAHDCGCRCRFGGWWFGLRSGGGED